ncbi:CAP-Gly domain-containing linker protein 1-like [Acropora millepora]|uniref:CAP-Gly domain-containing linker protein 1-like n=1 Tax=Acropora millepora TaxID=45264 RepID=UPI001CF14EF8|nr:CAP-Gly domain-containing linker protein 1-like [Acropora millepora]
MESGNQDQKPGARENREELMKKLHQIELQNLDLKRSLCSKQKSIQNIRDLRNERKNALRVLGKKHQNEIDKLEDEIKKQGEENVNLTREVDVIQAYRAEENVEEISANEKSNAENERIQEMKKELEAVNIEKKLLVEKKDNLIVGLQMTQRLVGEFQRDLRPANEEMKIDDLKLEKLTEMNNCKRKEFGGVSSAKINLNQKIETMEAENQKLKDEMQNTVNRLQNSNEQFMPDFKKLLENKIEVERNNAQTAREFAIWKLEAKIALNDKNNAIDAVREKIVAFKEKRSVDVKKKKKNKLSCFRRFFFRRQAQNNDKVT